jgi:hypothetical protein
MSGLRYVNYRLLKKMQRSDTIILGILAHFGHFRHLSGWFGYASHIKRESAGTAVIEIL